MTPVVRLRGGDADVRAVGREAVEALQADPGAAEVFAAVWSLHRRRRRQVAAGRVPAPPERRSSAEGARAGRRVRVLRAVWGTLLGAGLTAALVLAVEFAAPDRKNAFSTAETSAAVGLVAGTIAVALLAVVAVLPVPDARSGAVGGLGALLVLLLAGGVLVYRSAAGVDDRRGFSAEDLRWWIPMAAAVVAVLLVVASRCELARRGGRAAPPARPSASGPGRGDAVRELRRAAERLAAAKTPAAVHEDWRNRLDRLAERDGSSATLAQAKTMTPAAWLAWLGYDGEIELRSVLPRR